MKRGLSSDDSDSTRNIQLFNVPLRDTPIRVASVGADDGLSVGLMVGNGVGLWVGY